MSNYNYDLFAVLVGAGVAATAILWWYYKQHHLREPLPVAVMKELYPLKSAHRLNVAECMHGLFNAWTKI